MRGLDATGGQGSHSQVYSRRVRSDTRDCVAGRNVEESWKACIRLVAGGGQKTRGGRNKGQGW